MQRLLQWTGIVLAGVLVLAGATACGATNATSSSSSKPAANAAGQAKTVKATVKATAKPTTAKAPAGPLAAGQPARIGDIEVTYTGARILTPSQFEQPTAGDQYVVAAFSVQNMTAKPYNLSTLLQVTLWDKDGHKFTPTILGQTLNGDIDGTIPPSQKVAGEVPFEVPLSGAPYRVQFSQPFGSTTAQWAVTLP